MATTLSVLIFACIYFRELKKSYFASTYFACTNFCESTESEKKTWVTVKKTYLRLKSFIELHVQVLQAIIHTKRIIVDTIFFTIFVWYVTIRFPFIMIQIDANDAKLCKFEWDIRITIL